MSRRMLLALLLTLTALFAARPQEVLAETLTADLTIFEEPHVVNPTTATGDPRATPTGTGVFELNEARTALTYEITVFDIDFTGTQTSDTNDDLGAAHIHALTPPDETGPAVFGFFGTPFNETDPNDMVVTPFSSGVGGTISGKWDASEGNNTTLTEQIDNLLSGNTYVNFHTTQYPAGEIRGALVPEPSAAAAIAAMASISLLRRRRCRSNRRL